MNFSKKILRVVSVMLMVLILIPAIPSYAATFKDVQGHWAVNDIEKMVNLGFINGYTDGTFRPDDPVNLLQCLKLISMLIDINNTELEIARSSYSKVVDEQGVPSDAKDYIIKCLYKKVISVDELKNFKNLDLLKWNAKTVPNRLSISIYLAKAMGLEEKANSKPFVSLSYKDLLSIKSEYHKLLYVLIEVGVLNPNGTGNGYFEPESKITRAQMAKMLSTAYDYLQKNPQDSTKPNPVINGETVTGVVTSINKIGTNTFVTVKSNVEKAYLVDSNTLIKLDGKTTTISNILVGQEVKITLSKDSVTALSLEAETLEEEIVGTIKSVTPSSNKLVVEYKQGKDTKTIELQVDKNTDITLNGVDVDLYDLNAGDEVKLWIENNKVLELEATAKFGEVVGLIVELDEDYIIIKNSKGVKFEYEIDEDASIYRDGRRATYKDLRVGDEVTLELEYGIVVEIDAEMVEIEIDGFITGISTRLNSGTEITINNRETSKEETYTLARNAILKVDGKTASIADLNVGYFVDVVIGGNEIIELYADPVGAELMLRGKVTGVSTKRYELSLDIINSELEDYKYGDNITIEVSDDVLITEGSYKDLDLSDIKKGMTVVVFGYYDGYSFTANEIQIR